MIIAIDPDLSKSGVCIYDNLTKEVVALESLPMYALMGRLLGIVSIAETTILLEDASLIKGSSHHKSSNFRSQLGIASNVGKNKAVSVIIRNFCIENKIDIICIPPKGYSKKYISSDDFKESTGILDFETKAPIKRAINEDERAAAAIVYQNFCYGSFFSYESSLEVLDSLRSQEEYIRNGIKSRRL